MMAGVESEPAELGLPERMLRLLAEGGIRSTAELARRLEVSERLVTAMAEDLARHGYLAPIAGDCGSCSGCWAAESCTRPGAAPTLTLTPKGRRASLDTRT